MLFGDWTPGNNPIRLETRLQCSLAVLVPLNFRLLLEMAIVTNVPNTQGCVAQTNVSETLYVSETVV